MLGTLETEQLHREAPTEATRGSSRDTWESEPFSSWTAARGTQLACETCGTCAPVLFLFCRQPAAAPPSRSHAHHTCSP
eukprot:3969712-Pleurochrysis_carterae.AAC.2